MKRCLSLVLLLCLLLTGCNSYIAYTYTLTNGDSIKVSLDTSDGYTLVDDSGTFSVKLEDEILTQGTFITASEARELTDVVYTEGSGATSVKLDTYDDGSMCLGWVFNNTEFNYMIIPAEGTTCIILGNIVSQESADECLSRLSFEVGE